MAVAALVLVLGRWRSTAHREYEPDASGVRPDDDDDAETKRGLSAEGQPRRTGPLARPGLYLWREGDGGWVMRLISRGRRRGANKLEGSIEGLSAPPVLEGGDEGDQLTERGDAWRFTLQSGDPDTV